MIAVKNKTAMIKYLKVIQNVTIINKIYFAWCGEFHYAIQNVTG